MHWSLRPKNASSAPLTTRPSVGAARTGSRSAVVKTFSALRVHFAGTKLRTQRSPCPKQLSCVVYHGKIACATSALGQKRTSAHVRVMSALPPKADIESQSRNVRFVPKADMPATSRDIECALFLPVPVGRHVAARAVIFVRQ